MQKRAIVETTRKGSSKTTTGTAVHNALQVTAEVATHLRGGVNPNVAENLQKVNEELEGQVTGAPSNDADIPEFNPETMPAGTLDERKAQRAKQQSWGDWLYEKTVTRAAKQVGAERPSQRQIEDQVDETLTKAAEQERDKKAENYRYSPAAQKVRGERTERRATVAKQTEEAIKDVGGLFKEEQEETQASKSRRAAPVVINPISDHFSNVLEPLSYLINITDVFSDPEGDSLEFSAQLVGGDLLPDWINWVPKWINGTTSDVLGSFDMSEGVNGVAVSGNIAYVADYDYGLQILDVSNPTSPNLLGSYDIFAEGVTVNGDVAYVVGGNYAFQDGLHIIDVSNPAFPYLLGSFDISEGVNGFAVSDNVAYVAGYDYGLQLIDVSNPTSPYLLGNYDMDAEGVTINGDVAYVAGYYYDLQIIDISNPTSPDLLGSFDMSGQVNGVAVSSNIAYVVDYDYGLHIFDVSNPALPHLLGSYNTPGVAWGVTVSGNVAYVRHSIEVYDEIEDDDIYDYDIQIIDVSNSTNPYLLGRYDTPGEASGVVVSGNIAYVANIANEVDDEVGLWLIPQWNYYGLIGQPLLEDAGSYDIEIVAEDSKGGRSSESFQLVINRPPVVISDLQDYVANVSESFNYLVNASAVFSDPDGDNLGLSVQLVGGKPLPTWMHWDSIRLVGSYDTLGSAYGVTVNGNVAYVADDECGLQIIDVSNPTSPYLLGNYCTPGYALGVAAVGGNVAYVVYLTDDYEYGLQIIDVSNPTSPYLLGDYYTPGYALAVTVSGNVAYVAYETDYEYGLQIIDVSDSTNPYLLGHQDTPGGLNTITVSGNVAYVAGDDGLQLIDVSNSTSPYLLGSYVTSGLAKSVTVSDNVAYVVDYEYGLQIIDVSNSTNPYLLGSFDTPGEEDWDVELRGNIAYVAGYDGLQLIDVSNSTNPYLLGSCPGLAKSVTVSGNMIYIADDDSGLQIVLRSHNELIGLLPTNNDAGTYDIEVIADDRKGGKVSETFQLVINMPSVLIGYFPDQLFEAEYPVNFLLDLREIFNFPLDFSSLVTYQFPSFGLPSWLNAARSDQKTYNTPGLAIDVTVSGNVAYVADFDYGLQIIDVSNSTSPFLLGSYETLGWASGVEVSGDVAYVRDLSTGSLHIIDVSDPTSSYLLGSYDTLGEEWDFAVSGNIAYVAGYDGLQLIDVSDPTSPYLLGNYDTPGEAWGVEVSGNIAYVTSDDELQLIDVSNSTNPYLLGSYNTPEGLNDVTVSGNVAYVTGEGLQIIDVSDPEDLYLLGSYYTPWPISVTVSGDVAYVMDWDYSTDIPASLHIIDVSDPTKPFLLGRYVTSELVVGVAVSGNVAYVADRMAGLQLISTYQEPLLGFTGNPLTSDIGKYNIIVTFTDQQTSRWSTGFSMYVNQFPSLVSLMPDHSVGMYESFDYSFSPSSFFKDSADDTLMITMIEKGHAYLPDWLSLELFPKEVGTYVNVNAQAVQVHKTHAFVTGGYTGLYILDISQPDQSSLVVRYETPGKTTGLEVLGNTVLVADGYAGLQIIDVSNAASPVLLGAYDTPGNAYDVAYGVAIVPTVYVADGETGLQLITIDDPALPRLLAAYDTPGVAFGVSVSGHVAYVADGLSGVQIIDVIDPIHPVLLGSYDTPGEARGITVSEDKAYVADGASGLQIIDVSNPTNPRLLGTYNTPGVAQDITVSSGMAFVVDDTAGLQIIDVSDPTQPALRGAYATSGEARGITIFGSKAFVADGTNGLQILGLTDWRLSGLPVEADVGNYVIDTRASDSVGEMAKDIFVIRVEGPVVLINPILTPLAQTGQAFNFFLDRGTFFDPNYDAIFYSATLSNGDKLPSWLLFNQASAIFAGIPAASDAGELTITISAEDGMYPPALANFTMIVDNYPIVAEPIGSLAANIGEPFLFVVQEGTFIDNDVSDVLIYSVDARIGELPDWLSFNTTTVSLYGTAQEIDYQAQPLSIELTAYDGKQSEDGTVRGEVTDIFELSVQHFPTVKTEIPNQVADIGKGFDFTFEPDTFVDLDKDMLTYTATLDDGSVLPGWLTFDSVARRFYGTPQSSDLSIIVKVTARDGKGGSVSDRFKLLVSTPIEKPKVHKPGVEFYYVIDPSIFADVPETITGYQVRLADGSPLPSWLTFDETRLTLSGQSPVATKDIEIKIIAITPTAEQYSRTINFVFTENRVPVVQNRISNQVATVDQAFSFAIPGDTFKDQDGDELSYSAQVVGGEEWPEWLTFNKATRTFSGTPGRSDTNLLNSLSSRMIPLEVQASDAVGTGDTTFSITVEGQSWLESALQAGSAAATIFGIYRNRSLFLNRARDLRGKKANEAIIGESYSRQLMVPRKNIRLVKAQVKRESVPFSCGDRFFCGRWPYMDLPEGSGLPDWLKYDPKTCTLSGTPQVGDERELIIEVIGSGEVIKEWFELTVRAPKLEESAVIDVNAETSLGEDASMPSLPLTEGETGAGAASTAQLLTQSGIFGSEGQQESAPETAEVEMVVVGTKTPAVAATAQPAPKPAD